MDPEDKRTVLERFAKVNELRRKFWAELRAVRNKFLWQYPRKTWENDPDWIELHHLIDDLFQSQILEEAVRETGLLPDRSKARPHKRDVPSGIFLSDSLCLVCGLPLTGRQTKYCGDVCRNKAKSRQWRRVNPEANRRSLKTYLDSLPKSDLKKPAKPSRKPSNS